MPEVGRDATGARVGARLARVAVVTNHRTTGVVMAKAARTMLAGGLVTMAAIGLAQDGPDTPSVLPPAIIVEGQRPRVDDGMWSIHQWPTRQVFKINGKRIISMLPGWTVRTCIADGGADAAIARLLGNGERTGFGCSRLSLRIAGGRLSGRKACGTMISTETTYRGTLKSAEIDVLIDSRATRNGNDYAETFTRLVAERTGDCAVTMPAPTERVPIPASAPALVPAPAPVPSPPPAATPVPVPAPKVVRTIDMREPERATAAVEGSPDDIVVVARRLRKLRLRYTSTGRRMYFCHADVSSGDARVDRIGCAIVRACVRARFGERGPDIACFRRRVDSLEPDG